jgi:hypothetical protein
LHNAAQKNEEEDMRARSVGLVLVAVVLAAVPVRAQETEARPRYAFAFGTSLGVHVASMLSDNTWRVAPLPRGVYFGQFDMAYCLPFWSADGHTLVFTVEPEVSDPDDRGGVILSQVGSYDITTQRFQIHAELLDAAALIAEGSIYGGYCVAALSPDARYAWLNSTIHEESLLVDLETGAVLYSRPYMVTAAVWHTGYTAADEPILDYVFTAMSGIFQTFGENEQFILTLPDGERTADFPNAEGMDEQYVNRAFLLDWSNTILFSAYGAGMSEPQVMGLVDVEAGTVDYFDQGRDLQLSEDGYYASYVNTADELIVLDLEPFIFDTRAPAGKYTAWHGNVLVNVTVLGEEEPQDVIMTTYDYSGTSGIIEQVIFRGPCPDVILVSPNMTRILIRFQGGTFGLFDRDGGVVARTEVSNEEGTAQLWDYDPRLLWGSSARLYLGVLPQAPLESQSVSINATTGEVVFSPPGYIYLGETPTRWVLLAGGVEGMSYREYAFPELLATSLLTGETATLFAQEGEVVYRPFHGRFSEGFIWSPALD